MMTTNNTTSARWLLAGCALVALTLPAAAQQTFPSADAAAEALVDSLATNDGEGLRAVLGGDWKSYIPTAGIDQDDKTRFLGAWATKHEITRASDDRAHLAVGDGGWTFPIPIVKKGDGWRFDLRAGAEELRTRRIGRNELSAMQAMLAYCDAQREYAIGDRNADGVPEYARQLVSTPGMQNGLYWAALPGEPESPLGPLFGQHDAGPGYYGYYFKILEAQGPHAHGGSYDYLIGGRLTGGFALVAWPVRYADTGVMTFIVSHDGQVYDKDLGPDSNAAARAMKRFDPDETWTEVNP